MPTLPAHSPECDICDVWAALGGGKLRGRRGQAFWRGGDGFSVSLDAQKGLWYDHAVAEGGDALSLIQRALGCGFPAALSWLASFTGTPLPKRVAAGNRADATAWRADFCWATWWAVAVQALGESVLEDRRSVEYWAPVTSLLRTIGLGPESLVSEYRDWRARDPEKTRAMALAGRRAETRRQLKVAEFVKEMAREETSDRAARTCDIDRYFD